MCAEALDALELELGQILDAHRNTTFTAAVLRLEWQPARFPLTLARGVLNPEKADAPVHSSSRFDLASLTKSFTASAVLRLVAAGRLQLDARVDTYLPEFSGADKDQVTLRHLLTHTSGLPPLIRLFGPERPPGDLWDAIMKCPLATGPGQVVAYSDVGFMVLGRLIETITRQPLRTSLYELVLGPLSLRDTQYGPCPDAAATEFDAWRGRRIQGDVHDENAAVLGGASGHAGLFGSAANVSSLVRAYVAGPFLPESLAVEAVSEQAVSDYERRGLGWKLRSSSPDSPESAFSEQTFGHYGFTGTATWADPIRRTIIVLLTNRVYYGRDGANIQRLRREVFSAITGAIPESRDVATCATPPMKEACEALPNRHSGEDKDEEKRQ